VKALNEFVQFDDSRFDVVYENPMSSPATTHLLETRPATVADAGTLSELASTVFRDAYGAAFDSDRQVADFIALNFTPDALRTELEVGVGWYSLGFVNGVAAGFIMMEASKPPEVVGCLSAMHLSKLYVLRPFHGCGIANVLMERGLEYASQSGHSHVWLCVWEQNARAQAFYRRWGFSSVGEMLFSWSGVNFRDFVMNRRLTSSPTTDARSRKKNDIPFADDSEIATLVEQFEACTWPYERWTHRAHLAIGLSYIRTMSFDQALDRMRRQITLYNQTCGDPNGYNETITILFLKRIKSTCCMPNDLRPLHVLVDELTRCCSVNWLYEYYSKDRIWSPAAKSAWLEPDVKPLDF
jgi:ribosomal protein S18 acetylase RimI-like enzyme